MLKRIIALLTSLLFVLSLLAGCANETVPDDTTAPSAVTSANETVHEETNPLTAFESLTPRDLGGKTFRIYYISTDSDYNDFLATEANGAVQNDAVYARNQKVCQALNITLDIKYDAIATVGDALKKQYSSGGNDYDVFTQTRVGLPYSYQGYLYNLATIDTMNLDREYWDQDWINTMNFGGALYSVIGDMSISTLLFNSSVIFNKRIYRDLNYDEPYALVKEGKWTYEELMTKSMAYGSDTNGDGKMEYNVDTFGITGWGTESSYGMFYGSGFKFVNKNGEGASLLEFDSDKLATITEKVVKLWSDTSSYFNASGSSAQHSYPFSVFSEGRALYCDIVLSKIGTFMTEMDDAFGVLPEPKLNEDQDRYYSYVGYSIPLSMITANTTEADAETIGLIMEYFSATSYDDVTPQILEIVTKTRNVRDAESGEMINIIIRSKLFDPAHWFDLNGFGSFSRQMINQKTTSISTYVKTYNKLASSAWNDIVAQFEKNG